MPASNVQVAKIGDTPHGYKVRASVHTTDLPRSTPASKVKPTASKSKPKKKKAVREVVQQESITEQCGRLVLALEGSTLLKAISFDRGGVSPLNVLALEDNWWYIRDNPQCRILVRGHVDPEEPVADLSLGRAQSVRAFFIQRGVEPTRLIIAPGDRNGRRVDFVVIEQR
ncbi:hypothetical protein CYMTET_43170 [Cymbomonas tetramitiformis]|uniref:OmpA-like domain-containing protein n=1 Tax=Cymbomonas tetramitiformis TaxID=36881 RepID=A0AAE0F0W6_9CHLO|nr:hypothetical protein CYMTET_43170 [Cymbomonas tetramitiformis]